MCNILGKYWADRRYINFVIYAPSQFQIAQVKLEESKLLALQYLEDFVSEVVDPHQVALLTYALSIANSKRKQELFMRLDKIKRVGKQLRNSYLVELNINSC